MQKKKKSSLREESHYVGRETGVGKKRGDERNQLPEQMKLIIPLPFFHLLSFFFISYFSFTFYFFMLRCMDDGIIGGGGGYKRRSSISGHQIYCMHFSRHQPNKHTTSETLYEGNSSKVVA